MKTTVDTIAARELALYAENDGYLYRQIAQPIISNLARKMRKGQYDAQKLPFSAGSLARAPSPSRKSAPSPPLSISRLTT